MLKSLQETDSSGSGQNRLRVTIIGKSVLGKDIPLVEITDPVIASEPTRRLFVICRQHGNEPASTEAMLELIKKLVTSNDEQTSFLLSRVSFYIVPMMNPDGADRNIRRNVKGIDLNRDWLNLSQPETKCVHDKILEIAPDVLIDAHELSPGNKSSDFIETTGEISGASPDIVSKSSQLQDIVTGILMTHDITVKTYKINDKNPPKLAHRYFPIHGATTTLLFETRQAGPRQYQLQYRMKLHTVGTLTVAKYLAGLEGELWNKIAEHNANRWKQLASRSKKKTVKKN
ncbi:MAG: M14 family zinc carboxypeptidase [Armatimonadota bacterium]